MMRSFSKFVFLGCLALSVTTSRAQSPIAIELPKDYGRKWGVRVDGKNVPGTKVLDQLIKVKQARRDNPAVVVLLPNSARFADWTNIHGIVDKVGFSNVRYFALSEDGEKMIEVKREGQVLPVSVRP